MKDWIQIHRRTNSFIDVSLIDPKNMDLSIFDRMNADEHCLRCILEDPDRGRIRYSIENLISLKSFMNQVVFEKEEGYSFLRKLFETAIAVNRNKPVYFEPDQVYVSCYGDCFYFLVVPIVLDEWMFQKEDIQDWIHTLLQIFKTTSAYEVPGFMLRFLESEEFSLCNLVLGLENLRNRYYPPKRYWFAKKKRQEFRLAEPLHTLDYTPWKESIDIDATMLVHPELGTEANLIDLKSNQIYVLNLGRIIVGRGAACDIRIEDESLSIKHASIEYQEGHFFIKDLKSTNQTYLDGKPVLRKRKLKDGMHLKLGNIELQFHEEHV